MHGRGLKGRCCKLKDSLGHARLHCTSTKSPLGNDNSAPKQNAARHCKSLPRHGNRHHSLRYTQPASWHYEILQYFSMSFASILIVLCNTMVPGRQALPLSCYIWHLKGGSNADVLPSYEAGPSFLLDGHTACAACACTCVNVLPGHGHPC